MQQLDYSSLRTGIQQIQRSLLLSSVDFFILGFSFNKEGSKNFDDLAELANKLHTVKQILADKQQSKLLERTYHEVLNNSTTKLNQGLDNLIDQFLFQKEPQHHPHDQIDEQTRQLIHQLERENTLFAQRDLQKVDSMDEQTKLLIQQLQKEGELQDTDSEQLVKKLQEEEQQKQRLTLQQEQNNIRIARMIQEQLENEAETEKQNRIVLEQLINDQIQCSICLQPLLEEDIWPLECNHIYHRTCLGTHIKTSIQEWKFPIKCLAQECGVEMIESDLRELINAEDFNNFKINQFKRFVDQHGDEFSWCPTPGCEYCYVLENQQTEMTCLKCQKHYCIACRTPFHKGQTCTEYRMSNNLDENDKKFINYAKGQKFKVCQKCKMWVQKNEGCDHMTCRCGYEFCYICGGEYGNCECRLNNRRINVQPIHVPAPGKPGRLGWIRKLPQFFSKKK